MAEAARDPSSQPSHQLLGLLTKTMTTSASPQELREQAAMSRRRFVAAQLNALLIALLTCITLAGVAIFKLENFPQLLKLFFGAVANCSDDVSNIRVSNNGEFVCPARNNWTIEDDE